MFRKNYFGGKASTMRRQEPGFSYKQKSEDEIIILRDNKKVSTLRSAKAIEFLDKMETCNHAEQQQIMAGFTGNYKRGNERQARNHPRNI